MFNMFNNRSKINSKLLNIVKNKSREHKAIWFAMICDCFISLACFIHFSWIYLKEYLDTSVNVFTEEYERVKYFTALLLNILFDIAVKAPWLN